MDCSHGQGEEDTREQEGPGWGGGHLLFVGGSLRGALAGQACLQQPSSFPAGLQRWAADSCAAGQTAGSEQCQATEKPSGWEAV